MMLPQKMMMLSEALSLLKKDGFVLVENFLSYVELENIRREYDVIFEKIPDKREARLHYNGELSLTSFYNSGKHCVVQPNSYHHFPSLMSVFNLNYVRSFVENYCGPDPDFMMQIFMSQEYNKCDNVQEWSRNNWLHWDPYPALKFFLYLTDVGEGSAPTHVIPGTRTFGRKYREKMSLNDLGGWRRGCRHRLEDWEDHPTYTNKDAHPIYTTAGSLLIFDTDSLHFGGLLNAEGETRKTILLHHRPYNLRMPIYSERKNVN